MLDNWVGQLTSLVVTLLGGTFLGNWVSGKKNANDDKQELINQLQEERTWTSEQLKERDKKIDDLWEKFRQLEKDNNAILHEKRELEFELRKEQKEKEQALQENERLKGRIEKLEERVEELEKERRHGTIN